jgi:hypothetical protein
MNQRTLFDDWQRGRTIQERFEAFDQSHPEVYRLFKRFAFELLQAGRKRYGAKSLIERIRWHMATTADPEEDWKIDNRHTSRYVRKLIAEHPEFAGFFELRKLKAK